MQMKTTPPSNIDPFLVAWATAFCEDHKENMSYFLKHGNPLEKALVLKVVELAGGEGT